jgi:hypothetical protein
MARHALRAHLHLEQHEQAHGNNLDQPIPQLLHAIYGRLHVIPKSARLASAALLINQVPAATSNQQSVNQPTNQLADGAS